jgi:pimeloyl-ACP methyl ester carboxylesterase
MIARHTAVLLHGIMRTYRSMRSIEKNLKRKGYEVINIDYPSRTKPVEELSEDVYNTISPYCNREDIKLAFIAHSMGGLVLRNILLNHPIHNLERFVMLSTPNAGSEVADFLKNFILYQRLYGPAGQQLTTKHDFHVPDFAANTKVGIIAGRVCLDPISYFLLPKPHDGKVSVESTKLKGMHDHIVLPVSHSFMMFNPMVIKQIDYFLKHGQFNHC